MAPLVDPRLGDVEDDASSTKRRSLLGIAGSLLAEISIPKLLTAWLFLIVLPGSASRRRPADRVGLVGNPVRQDRYAA